MAAMELFPKGMVLEAGEVVVVVVWRKGGEEERGRGGGGLYLEETLRSPVPRPFRNPSGAPLGPFQGLSSVLSRTFASAVLWQGSALRTTMTGKDGDDARHVNRVIEACGAAPSRNFPGLLERTRGI